MHPPGAPGTVQAAAGVDIGAEEAWALYDGGSRDVVVALVVTGIDYTHADLEGRIWVNEDEIPGNGVDDDGNGYIDDVYGWNFYSAAIRSIRAVRTATAPTARAPSPPMQTTTSGSPASSGATTSKSWQSRLWAGGTAAAPRRPSSGPFSTRRPTEPGSAT